MTEGFQSIVFDCDSTLASVEGIDELAGEQIAEIQALTAAAMEGTVPLEEVYGRRLEMIRPSSQRVARLGALYVDSLVEDARETVAALLWLGKDVRVISGGLLPPVEAVARELGIPASSVSAVGISFDRDGAYSGFDSDSPLARSGGKLTVLRSWNLPRPALLVGDGATDLEARPGVDLFAAYMGVAYRPVIAEAADVVLRESSLSPVLSLAASYRDRERLESSDWGELLQRGDSLLALARAPSSPAAPSR